MNPLQICHRCAFRGNLDSKSIPCMADAEKRDIIQIAEKGDCPKGFFAPPTVPPAIPLAGDLVKAVAEHIGADKVAAWVASIVGEECGCEERRRKLNSLDRRLRRWLRL